MGLWDLPETEDEWIKKKDAETTAKLLQELETSQNAPLTTTHAPLTTTQKKGGNSTAPLTTTHLPPDSAQIHSDNTKDPEPEPKLLHCIQCFHVWAQKGEEPKQCPKCRKRKWKDLDLRYFVSRVIDFNNDADN